MKRLRRNILHHYPFSLEHLKELIEDSEWNYILNNRNINWTSEILRYIENQFSLVNRFRDNNILINPAIASNQKIVMDYFHKLDKKSLHRNRHVNWNEYLIGQLSDHINLSSLSNVINVSIDFLQSKSKEIDWDSLSMNSNINWNTQFLENNKDLLNWKKLSINVGLPWSEKLIETFEDRWSWIMLSQNSAINWTESLMLKYQEKLNWTNLCARGNVNFSIEFIKDNIDNIDFVGISRNHKIPWSIEFIDKYRSKLNFSHYGLSWNTSLPWDLQLINKYKDRWSWSGISSNIGIPWDNKILRTFEKKLVWGKEKPLQNSADESHRSNGFTVSNNPSLPWTIELLDTWDNYWSRDIDTNSGIWKKIIKPIATEEMIKNIMRK